MVDAPGNGLNTVQPTLLKTDAIDTKTKITANRIISALLPKYAPSLRTPVFTSSSSMISAIMRSLKRRLPASPIPIMKNNIRAEVWSLNKMVTSKITAQKLILAIHPFR